METLSSQAKLSIGMLAFAAGAIITSFIVSIPTLERQIGLSIATLQWLEVTAFTTAFVFLFPALDFTQQYGARLATIVAGTAILIGSCQLFLFPNQYGIILSRLIDGVAGALIIAIFYVYSDQNRLQFFLYASTFALGVIFGPLIAHYSLYYNWTMFSTLFLFFILPLMIIAAGWMMPAEKYAYHKNKHSLLLTGLIIGTLLPIIIIFLYNQISLMNLWGNLFFVALSIGSLFSFFYVLSRNRERHYLIEGMPTRINLIIAINLITISAIMIFWMTILPIYMFQVAHHAVGQPLSMIALFDLVIIMGAYVAYFTTRGRFQAHVLIQSYLVIALGLGFVLNFWQSFGFWQIALGTVFIGLGLGMVFMNLISLMLMHELKEGQILVNTFFYICCGIFIGYIPLAGCFYAIEQYYNAQLISQQMILLPVSLATPEFENYLVLSNSDSLSEHFSPQEIIQLKAILKTSFIGAIHAMMIVLFIVATLVLMVSNFILNRQPD